MSDLPVREQVLQALAERLGARRGLGSYAKEDLPLTVVIDEPDQVEDFDYEAVHVLMPVEVVRVVKRSGEKNDRWHEDANVELALLQAEAIGSDETLGGLARSVVYAGGSVDVTDGAGGFSVQLRLAVRYAFKRGNPFERVMLDDFEEE